MFTLTRILLCLALSLSAAGASAGQHGRRTKAGRRTARTRPARRTAGLVVVPRVSETYAVRQVGRAKVEFNKIGDYYGASVLVSLPEFNLGPGRSVGLSFNFGTEGKVVRAPSVVETNFSGSTEGVRADRVVWEADGKQFSFRLIAGDRLFSLIDFASFEQIANSQSVKVRLGRLAFDLNEGQREAMRDLLRTVGLPAQEP